jgi:site-specific recombinase XerD
VPKKLTDPRLETRSARLKLKPRATPYFRTFHEGWAVAYRRLGGKNGTWLARLYRAGVYERHALGVADDFDEAAGDILTFAQAQERALAWFAERTGQIEAIRTGGPDVAALTVKDVIDAYCKMREARSVRGLDATQRLNKHVPADGAFAAIRLVELSEHALSAWRQQLAPMAPATVNRLLNDLRAALTMAITTHRRRLPAHLPGDVRAALKAEADATEARDIQRLTDADITRLVDAAYAEGEQFGQLVLVLAATGTRFSQAVRIPVAGVDRAGLRIFVPASGKGRRKRDREPKPVPVDKSVLERLSPVLSGLQANGSLPAQDDPLVGRALLLLRPDGEPWKTASQMTRAWDRAVAAAELSVRPPPIVLRHSSIVRQLERGSPTYSVAILHDTGEDVIARHYARFVTSDMEKGARKARLRLTQARGVSAR